MSDGCWMKTGYRSHTSRQGLGCRHLRRLAGVWDGMVMFIPGLSEHEACPAWLIGNEELGITAVINHVDDE